MSPRGGSSGRAEPRASRMFVSVTEDVVTAAYAKGGKAPSMIAGVPVK
jgi:hypothetical protein